MHCTVHLTLIYDAMPLVKAMKDYTDSRQPTRLSAAVVASNNDDKFANNTWSSHK